MVSPYRTSSPRGLATRGRGGNVAGALRVEGTSADRGHRRRLRWARMARSRDVGRASLASAFRRRPLDRVLLELRGRLVGRSKLGKWRSSAPPAPRLRDGLRIAIGEAAGISRAWP